VQGETGPWKDARAGGANPDWLAKPTRSLALERQAAAVAAHQLVKADEQTRCDNEENAYENEKEAANHGRRIR
jgi:hypothetical protein